MMTMYDLPEQLQGHAHLLDKDFGYLLKYSGSFQAEFGTAIICFLLALWLSKYIVFGHKQYSGLRFLVIPPVLFLNWVWLWALTISMLGTKLYQMSPGLWKTLNAIRPFVSIEFFKFIIPNV
jgi:hypothetical protein